MLDLPESCISAIFSFTMPRDISRLSVVSKLFKSVSYSDDLWNKFLMPGFIQIAYYYYFSNGSMPKTSLNSTSDIASVNFFRENGTKGVSPIWSDLKIMVAEAKKVMGIQSFQIFVAQGVMGSFPWLALSFVPMWLELIGFSHEETAFLMTLFTVGCSLGGLFGGRMRDVIARRLPNAGRIILSQISAGLAIPLSAVLLLVMPRDPSTGLAHGLMFFIMGIFISWNGAATNNPIFAEIVPEKERTTIYALDRSFETILSSFAPPVVGILAQHVHDSRFEVLAKLTVVSWLEVRGQIDCRFLSPDTNYRVVFVLKFRERQFGWTMPVTFSITTPDREQMENTFVIILV